ncbi:MAG: DUF1489 family protein [Rubrimonas sp.]
MSQRPVLHLLKLCVGAASVEDLLDWRERRRAEAVASGADPTFRHVTRMWPRRADELLAGGSLYWVFKGAVLARQRILALDRCDLGDGVERCAIVLDDEVIRTRPQPRRPFQGWRYLSPEEAPPDLDAADAPSSLPHALQAALAELGVGRRSRR